MESFTRPAMKLAFWADPTLDCKDVVDDVIKTYKEQGKPYHMDRMHFKLLSLCQAEKLLSTNHFHKQEINTVKAELKQFNHDCSDFQAYLKQHTLLRRPELLQYAEAECNVKKYSDEDLFIFE